MPGHLEEAGKSEHGKQRLIALNFFLLTINLAYLLHSMFW